MFKWDKTQQFQMFIQTTDCRDSTQWRN